MTHRRLSVPLLVVVSVLSVAGIAVAGDGVIEINQARALAGGLSQADGAGFPVTVCSGSYRLTSDLVLASGGVALNAIEVDCDGATIDLNGFQIQGYALCNGNPGAGCSNGGGPGSGVAAHNGGGNFVTVRNGTITGMFGNGVLLGREARIEDLTVFRNGGNGVAVGAGSLVDNVNSSNNAGGGIRSADGSGAGLLTRIHDVHVESNGGQGILTGGLVENLVAVENLDGGLVAGFFQVTAGTVDGCQVAGTIRNGILAATVRHCTVQGKNAIQALTAEDNYVWADATGITCRTCRANFVIAGPAGIEATTGGGYAGAVVEDNQVTATTCLDLQSDSGYRNNTLSCQGAVSSGINLGGNLCGTSLCP